MATLKQTVLDILNNDSALTAVFTGGFSDSENLPFDGLTVDNLAYEANGVTIQPQGVLRWRGMNPMPGPINAVRRFVEIYLYDDPTQGFQNIDYGKRRIWTLFKRKYISGTDNEGFAYLIWAGDVGEMFDDELQANMDRVRYEIDMTRK